MNDKYLKNTRRRKGRERGVVLIAVLMFIAMILPITLLILDSVRIESLLPVNEAFTRTAGDEADKGFQDAIAAIMADNDPFLNDTTRDFVNDQASYFVNTNDNTFVGRHDFDYLAEMWARHPENDTIFIVERSLENYELAFDPNANPDAGPDEDVHSIPARWQLMDVPFGIDDFGEYYDDGGDSPRLLLPFEYMGEDNTIDRDVPAFYLHADDISILNISGSFGPENNSPAVYSANDLMTYWQLSPADPEYYENVASLDPVKLYHPRPASYFRNTNGEPFTTSLGDAILPVNEGATPSTFMRSDNNAIDRFVYDCLFDYNDATNQYPVYMPLQQACADSTWANEHFGSTGASGALGTLFTSSNREYKPAPGTLTPYQLGSDEDSIVPGWHETIVSDESGRFPINSLLNIIYSSHNFDYNDPVMPEINRDRFDDMTDIDDVITDDNHPNHGGFLMARDILTSLLMEDGDMARLADSWDNNLFSAYQEKATWLIRQMLARRIQLDETSDYNRNGDLLDDETVGEIHNFPLPSPLPAVDLYDGSGRIGDGTDLWDGTWRVFTNPKEMLTNFTGNDVPPADSRFLSQNDFYNLNQRVTVYSMDTEHTADPQHRSIASTAAVGYDVRQNINHMRSSDDSSTPLEDESALYNILLSLIGRARVDSIINWRDGLVDLNGDGDLNDEFIEQPVSSQLYDPSANIYDDADDNPVSTITYRERNHPNFQDPFLEDQFIDPDYLNIRSLGDLITIPMSRADGLIAFSEANNATDFPDLRIVTSNGNDPGGVFTSIADRVYPDFSLTGSEILYDDGTDSYSSDALLTTGETMIINGGKHPSYGQNDTMISYYDNDDLRVIDIGTGTDSLVLANADLPDDVDDTTTLDFWGEWTDNMVGGAEFEMASPDLNPNAGYPEIAFTQIGQGTGDFLDPNSSWNIVTTSLDGTLIDLLTDNPAGTFDYAPDFSPDGEWIVFTRTTYEFATWIGLDFMVDPVPAITTLMIMHRTGGGAVPLHQFFDVFSTDPFIDVDFANQLVTMHQPMFPNFSDDGEELVFMDVEVTMNLGSIPPPFPATWTGGDNNPDIYTMDAFNILAPWADCDPVPIINTNEFEVFPDWGSGALNLISQNDTAIGTVGGPNIDMTSAQTATTDVTPDNVYFTETERQAIAVSIGEASIALRMSLGTGSTDQNWRLKDLPAVPEQTVDVLAEIADIVCFRDPYVTYDPEYNLVPDPLTGGVDIPPLQAYPGRVNINTASRPVLRSTFLLMFQGPENDPDDDGPANAPTPRISGEDYVNLMDPSINNQTRFYAMMVADRYAQQVTEYRKWVYNNQGNLGVTDETVPSNLPLYEQAYVDEGIVTGHHANYRANPYYPLIDTDGDGFAPDLDRIAPDPPFRNIAGLFNVMLYDDDEFSAPWTYEGIDGSEGPDGFDLPRTLDTSGAPVGSLDVYEVWGPIYMSSDTQWCTHPDSGGYLAGGTMYGFAANVDNDQSNPFYNDFYEHQSFRLFSADDFRRIAPWLTTRTYNYRIESRGVVRVASGAQRTDITRDKIWFITTNVDANFAGRVGTSLDILNGYDISMRAQNRGTDMYSVLYYEETPQSGYGLTRRDFVPE